MHGCRYIDLESVRRGCLWSCGPGTCHEDQTRSETANESQRYKEPPNTLDGPSAQDVSEPEDEDSAAKNSFRSVSLDNVGVNDGQAGYHGGGQAPGE